MGAPEEQSFCKSIRTKEALFTCIIPAAFVERHGHLLGKELTLGTASGSWKLGVSQVDGETFIETGWRGFCADNRLAVDDVVVFQLVEASKFLIKVYGGDGSRKTIEPAPAAPEAAKSVENATEPEEEDFAVQITPGGNDQEEHDGNAESEEDRTATGPEPRDPECPAAPVTPSNCAISKAIVLAGTESQQRANNKRKNIDFDIDIQVLESDSDDDNETDAVGFIFGSVAPTLRKTYFTRKKSLNSSAVENAHARRTSGESHDLDAGSGTLDSETNSEIHHRVASKKSGAKRGARMNHKNKKTPLAAPVTSSESALAAASAFRSSNPCFPIGMKRTSLHPNYYLHVASAFVKEHMPKEDLDATMLDEEDQQYPVKWLARGVVSGGWRAFARARKIMPEDAIALEVIDDGTFRCHIFRGTAAH